MSYNKYIHNRRSVRLRGWDYSQSGFYFITICTQDRVNLFGDIVDGVMVLNDYGVIARDQWFGLGNYFPNITLDAFCVMPNHIHGIIVIDNDNSMKNDFNKRNTPVGANINLPHCVNLPNDINYGANLYSPLRGDITNDEPKPRIKGTSKTIGSMVRGFKINVAKELGFSIFQRNYHEHIIRNQKSYDIISKYIRENPLNWEKDSLK